MADELHDDATLALVCARLEEEVERSGHYAPGWRERIASFLEELEGIDERGRASLELQRRLWTDNPIPRVGLRAVGIGEVITDPELRASVASLGLQPLPDAVDERIVRLEQAAHELVFFGRGSIGGPPPPEVLATMAALFPDDFTTITDVTRLQVVYEALCPERRVSTIGANVLIMRRLAAVLGSPEPTPRGRARRMTLPWLLYGLQMKSFLSTS